MDDGINFIVDSLEDNRIRIAANRNGKDISSIKWMLWTNFALKFLDKFLFVLPVHHRPRVENFERL